MENQPQPHKSRRKNPQPVRSTTGTSSQPPLNPETQRPTSAAQTMVPATLPTRATETKAPPSTTAQPLADVSETEKVMMEFLAKFGQEEKASAVLAKMAEAFRLQEEASQLTPLYIPPRKFNIQETATTSTSFPAPDLPPEGEIECTVEEVMEEAERAEKERKAEKGTGEDVVIKENTDGQDDVVEGEDLDVAADDNARNSEGGVDDEGETPEKNEEGETPEKNVEGETPEKIVEGETPGKNDKGETPVETGEIEEPEDEGLKEIVVLGDDPDSEGTPVTERMTRRTTRRSRRVEELESSASPRKLQIGAQETEVGGEDAPEITEAEERRLAAERKRKGKQEVQVLPKKPRKSPVTELTEEPMHEAIKVPFVKGLDGPTTDDETEDNEEEEQSEEPIYERTEVWITKKLLEAMAVFDDPKRAQTYKDRGASGKLVKSGKRYNPESLQEIESEEEFLSYIRDIGFEWLLNHSTQEVPIAVAREFFATFRFKSTVDQDADSISFRLFNEEYVMSIREWSLRMGLFTNEEDEEGIWNERMIGAPKNTPGFKPQSAWDLVTHKRGGVFKTSVSKGFHIANHLLRFAQVFIGYNLMGTASSALTTPELYFTWCMAKKIKVHLGYWLAQACHLMTSNPSRHLYTCHILGAYLQRNIVMKIAKAAPVVTMCEAPELFSVEYFFNKGLIYMDGQEVCFYEIGKAEATVKKELEGAEGLANVDGEDLKKEMIEVRRDISEVRKEIQELKGSITGLTENVAKQSDRMAEAVGLMMKMVGWLEKKFPQTQQKLLPGPSSVIKPPGQGTSSLQKPPSVSKPVAILSVRKPVSKQAEIEEEEPASPVRKKVKTNRPNIPPKSGSRGGQTQN